MTDHDRLELADAPEIPGLRFRPFRDEADIPAIVELTNAAFEANGETERWTVASMRNELGTPTSLPASDSRLLAFVDDRLVADAVIDHEDTTEGARQYQSLGHVDPAWRRRGLGRALMRESERRLRALAERQAHPGPRLLVTWLSDPNVGGIALARELGYRKVRVYHHMTRPDMEDIEVPPLPEGIEVRPITRADLPQVFDAGAEAFLDHFGGHDFSDAARKRWMDDPLLDPDLLVVAFDGHEVAAAVQGYIEPAENEANGYLRGWTDPVFTRRAWRRRGLAAALLGRALVRLRDRGMTSAQLDVDSANENQALTLYERHRFAADRSTGEWHRPMP